MNVYDISISRLNRREWIETSSTRLAAIGSLVSPGLIAGSGLKPGRRVAGRV